MEKINANFLGELFRKAFISSDIATALVRYLDFKFIPKEEVGFKFVLKEFKEQWEQYEKLPSIGAISQKYNDNDNVQLTIQQIKASQISDNEILLTQFESYIKDSEFQLLNKRIVELYNEGKKDEAIEINRDESERICNFSIRANSDMFLDVFGDFDRQRHTWQDQRESSPVVPFGIDVLDDLYGGIDAGDIELWLARSGVGKSTVLRWRAFTSALSGNPVLHIQCEEDKQKVHMKYTQMWTFKSFSDLKNDDFTSEELKALHKTIKQIQSYAKDIKIYSFKKFGDATIFDIRNLILEYKKVMGYFPRVVIIDSFNLVRTGINSYDNDPKPKYRLQECGKRLKNMAEEFGLSIVTATQTGDVPFEVWNDEEKVIDRSYAEGDRTVVQPFSWVFSINQTLEEIKNKVCRIYKDKVRDYENNDPVFKIALDYGNGRFYDRKRTMAEFKDTKIVYSTKKAEKKVIKRGARI